MKKYVFSAIVLFSMLLTSCSNDDITIGAPSTISVNASEVISSFVQYKAGELEAMEAGQKLRLRALVYNSKGELVFQATDFFTNYNVQLKTSSFLSPGEYTVIGISDVVEMSGTTVTTEWWKLSGENKLSEMVITDQQMIGYNARILGVGKGKLTVQGSQSNSTVINLKPVGTLVYVFIENTSSFSNISAYTLWSNKSSAAISFNSNGDYSIIEDYDSDYNYIIASLKPVDGYLYNYILPMNNVKLWFTATQNDKEKTFPTDEGAIWDVKSGEEYECDLIMNEDISKITTNYVQINLSSAATRSEWAGNWKKRINLKKMSDI